MLRSARSYTFASLRLGAKGGTGLSMWSILQLLSRFQRTSVNAESKEQRLPRQPQTDQAEPGPLMCLQKELGCAIREAGGRFFVDRSSEAAPLLTRGDIANAFLEWLQSDIQLHGKNVAARLLEDLFARFISHRGISEGYTWRSIAREFVKLPGVHRKQRDFLYGPDRVRESHMMYAIPNRLEQRE